MRIIAVVNRKGGVGKTTTAVNLAASLALGGQRALLVDLDPQGSVARSLGLEPPDAGAGASAAFASRGTLQVRYPAHRDLFRLGVLAADAGLEDEASRLVADPARRGRLATTLHALRDPWAVAVIDTPPALGGLADAAIAAADGIVLPTTTDYLALDALRGTLDVVRAAEKRRGAPFAPLLVVPTMVETRRAAAETALAHLREAIGEALAADPVPRSARLDSAALAGEPLVLAAPTSAPARAYAAAARSLLAAAARPPGKGATQARRSAIKGFTRADMREALRTLRSR